MEPPWLPERVGVDWPVGLGRVGDGFGQSRNEAWRQQQRRSAEKRATRGKSAADNPGWLCARGMWPRPRPRFLGAVTDWFSKNRVHSVRRRGEWFVGIDAGRR